MVGESSFRRANPAELKSAVPQDEVYSVPEGGLAELIEFVEKLLAIQPATVADDIATRGRDVLVRVYLGVWENPHPEKKLVQIQYVSTMETQCDSVLNVYQPLRVVFRKNKANRGLKPTAAIISFLQSLKT